MKILLSGIIRDSSFTGPKSVMTYQIEGDKNINNTCLCFEKSIGGLTCTKPFNIAFKMYLEPCEATLVDRSDLIYTFFAPHTESMVEAKKFPTSSEVYVSKPQGISAWKCSQKFSYQLSDGGGTLDSLKIDENTGVFTFLNSENNEQSYTVDILI